MLACWRVNETSGQKIENLLRCLLHQHRQNKYFGASYNSRFAYAPKYWLVSQSFNHAMASSLDSELSFYHVGRLWAGWQVGLLTSNPNFEIARLQHPFSIFVGVGHLPFGKRKFDSLLLARLQANASKALQLN